MALAYSALCNCVGANLHAVTAVTEASTALPHSRCWGRGGCCSAAVAQFSGRSLFPTGGKGKMRGTRWLRFTFGLAVPRGLAFVFVFAFSCQWPFSPQSRNFCGWSFGRLGGDMSLNFSWESLNDLPSRGRRSDLSLSLRGNSLRFSSASREREEKRDDAKELLLP